MPSALTVDLRERLLVTIGAGASCRKATRLFEVSLASAVRWYRAFVREGLTWVKPMCSDQSPHTIEAKAGLIWRTSEPKPELFLRELRARLAERGLRVEVSNLSRSFKRHGITRYKHEPDLSVGLDVREGGAPSLVQGRARD